MHRIATDIHRFGIQVHIDLARTNDRLRMPFGSANDRVNACDQFLAVEWFCQIVIGPESKSLDLVIRIVRARQDQNRRIDTGEAQLP